MMKYKNTRDSISTELLLWREPSTQISVKDVYSIKVHPTSTLYNESTINFNIPPQMKGMMTNIDIITKFKIKKGNSNLVAADNCSIINNFANSLWELVGVQVGDRLDLMQSMRNSYSYQTFFDYALNSDKNREDYLFSTQLFKMDSGETKSGSETMIFTGDGIINKGAAQRHQRIALSNSVTVSSRLHCPLITTEKALPSNMKVRVSLSKNNDKFLLMSSTDEFKVVIEDIHLRVSYIRPHDIFHDMIEKRIAREPAPYYITRPELIVKPISQSGRHVRVNNIYPGRLPKYSFFCIVKTADFEGRSATSGFNFIPYGKFQLFLEGNPYFPEPLEMEYKTKGGVKHYTENRTFLEQLYSTIGRSGRGCGMVTSENFQLNFMVGLSLTDDRSPTTSPYLSSQRAVSSQVEIDFGYDINIADDMLLLCYSVYDRLITIDGGRNIEIID